MTRTSDYPYQLFSEAAPGVLPYIGVAGNAGAYFVAMFGDLGALDDDVSTLYEALVDIEEAKGSLLDLWGDLYNEPRGSLGDFEFRRLIAARVVVFYGAVTYPRVWQVWLALTKATDGVLYRLEPASIQLTGTVTWTPSQEFLIRGGDVLRAAMGAGYEVNGIVRLGDPTTALFDEALGFDVGVFSFAFTT